MVGYPNVISQQAHVLHVKDCLYGIPFKKKVDRISGGSDVPYSWENWYSDLNHTFSGMASD